MTASARRRLGAVLLALLLVACGVASARPSVDTGITEFKYDKALMDGLQLIDDGKYIKARELAERYFNESPESFQSWFLMGLVLESCEGNLPRAWFFLNGARERLERIYGGENIPQDGPWWAHLRLLIGLAEVAGQMEKFEEELVLLEIHDRLYKPSAAAAFAWPLMKLGRYEEARKKIAQALRERPNDENSVAMAYNSLGAVEGEQGHIEKAYDTFRLLIDTVKRRGWTLEATYYHNAAEQAMELHRFGEQESLLIEATKHFDPRSYTNPYIGLSQLYTSSGRVGEGLSAIRRMHQWSHATEPRIEQQHWNEQQETTAAALLAAGYDIDALALMRRTLNRPDRRGANSMNPEQTEIASLTLYRELLAMEGERYSEHATWCTWGEWLRLQAARLDNQREVWAAASRTAATIISNQRLEWSLRPYAIDSRVYEWMRPSMARILGDGVVSVELGRLLARTDEAGRREKPYLLASLGEAEAARGDLAVALEHFGAAAETLPETEVMLRMRVAAVRASCLERQGDFAAAVGAYRRVLEKAPTLIRELGLAIPVRIEHDGSSAAATAAKWLHRSPRFNDVGAGFILQVSSTAGGLEGRLLCEDGTLLCSVMASNAESASETARGLCQELHMKAFTPKLDLAQTDINSLDGSNQTDDSNREKLFKVFGLPDASASPKPSP